MKESIIQVTDVSKIYLMGKEKVIALRKVNLSFEKGKIYCIIGTSGSGKSTLLNLMAGLEKPTIGGITVKQKYHLEKMSERKLTLWRQKEIGFVFQSYNLMNQLSALENVALPLVFKGYPRVARVKMAAKMLRQVGLGDRLKHRPNQMSGGQQQRVSIARAFVSKPQIVFADEPTGNLDTKTSLEVMELITTMAREHGQTLIIVTHDAETAEYADIVISIRDGQIEKIIDQTDNKGEARENAKIC